MPGGGEPVRGGVRATDEGRGTILLGASEGTGKVQGVRGGDGGWIFGGEHDDKRWASGRGEMDLENLDNGGRSADVTHVLPGQGRPKELPV